jgi:hypothetical protein
MSYPNSGQYRDGPFSPASVSSTPPPPMSPQSPNPFMPTNNTGAPASLHAYVRPTASVAAPQAMPQAASAAAASNIMQQYLLQQQHAARMLYEQQLKAHAAAAASSSAAAHASHVSAHAMSDAPTATTLPSAPTGAGAGASHKAPSSSSASSSSASAAASLGHGKLRWSGSTEEEEPSDWQNMCKHQFDIVEATYAGTNHQTTGGANAVTAAAVIELPHIRDTIYSKVMIQTPPDSLPSLS